jgi:predicted MFS family arabinose efflux permease
LALFLLIFVQFANEYSFNNPQALQDSIQKTFDINEAKFNALYTIIALPNIFFSIVAGIIVDYIGIRKSFVIFSIGLPLSQTIVALGGTYGNYNLMLAGRFFFGIIC